MADSTGHSAVAVLARKVDLTANAQAQQRKSRGQQPGQQVVSTLSQRTSKDDNGATKDWKRP